MARPLLRSGRGPAGGISPSFALVSPSSPRETARAISVLDLIDLGFQEGLGAVGFHQSLDAEHAGDGAVRGRAKSLDLALRRRLRVATVLGDQPGGPMSTGSRVTQRPGPGLATRARARRAAGSPTVCPGRCVPAGPWPGIRGRGRPPGRGRASLFGAGLGLDPRRPRGLEAILHAATVACLRHRPGVSGRASGRPRGRRPSSRSARRQRRTPRVVASAFQARPGRAIRKISSRVRPP